MLISKDGYDNSSKFLALKPGEKVTADVELRKATGQSLADFFATITDANGTGVTANVTLTNQQTAESVLATSDANGQLSVKVPQGTYKVEVKASGFASQNETLQFQSGKAVLRTFTLSPGL